MKEKLNEISLDMFNGSTEAYDNLEGLKKQIQKLNMIVINVKISTGDNPETRALSKTGDIISEALANMVDDIDNLENSTFEVKEMSKQIKSIIEEIE